MVIDHVYERYDTESSEYRLQPCPYSRKMGMDKSSVETVSYTHLTLPTN